MPRGPGQRLMSADGTTDHRDELADAKMITADTLADAAQKAVAAAKG